LHVAETELHERLAVYRIRCDREHFRVTAEVAIAAVEEVAQRHLPREAGNSGALERALLLQQAQDLLEVIQRSKKTAGDPWAYTPKARDWGRRAQKLVDQLTRGEDSEVTRAALDKLLEEVEGDRDFKEARRLF
jgi:hypothetical protein